MRDCVADNDGRLLARAEPAAATARAELGLVQGQVSLDEQGVGAAEHGGQVWSAEGQLRDGVPVIEAGHELEANLDLARLAPNEPDQLVIGVDSGRIVRWGALTDGEEVGDCHIATVAFEAGLQDVRAGEVATAGPIRPCGGDHAVAAATPVEQPAEDWAGIEAVKAAPVDGAVARDQGRRVAVADQRVIADPRVAPDFLGGLVVVHRWTIARAASSSESAKTSGLGYTPR